MLVMLLGIVTLASRVHPSNVPLLMVDIFVPMVTLTRLVQRFEDFVSDGENSIFAGCIGQVVAVFESIVSDAGDAVWNRKAGQTAIYERLHPDVDDTV